MNLNKHIKFFDPINSIGAPIHIIGCGAIGSTLAEMLVRMGVPKLHLYDFDTVSEHNIANQMFTTYDIGLLKTYALDEMLRAINPAIKIVNSHKGYINQVLSGYVFLCVDNIDLRREIVEAQQYNPNIKAMFDFRMRLTDAQHYAADFSDLKSIKEFLSSMQFTHEEAKQATPTNACGTSMNIIPTVRVICSLGLSNFINFVKEGNLKKMILIDAFHFIFDVF